MARIIIVPSGQSKVVASGPQYGVKYTLLGPDGTRVTFNDREDVDHVGWITDMTGMDSPEVRESADDLIGDDGGVHGDFFYGRRPITMSGMIDNNPGVHHTNDVITPVTIGLVKNPRAATATTGWSVSATGGVTGTTFARAAMPDNPNEYGLRTTGTNANDSTNRGIGAITATGTTRRYPVKPDTWYVGMGEVYIADGPSASPSNAAQAHALFYQSDATTPASTANVSLGVHTPVVDGTRYRMAAAFKTPSNAAFIAIQARVNTATPLDTLDVYWTRLQLYEGDQDLGYFDGDTYPATNYPYRSNWLGASHDSTSALSTAVKVPKDANEVRNIRMTQLQRATSALRKDASLRWAPEGGIDQVVSVRRQQPLRLTGSFNKEFQVALVAADHRIYSQVIQEKRILPNTTTDTVENVGTAPSPPSITLTGPATNPTLTNFTTGETIALTYTLTAGNYISFDFRNRTVLLNDTTNLYDKVTFATASWWQIQPGVNNIRWAATSTTGASLLTLRWQNAWT